jgi:alkylated DNA repair dioxygenase AlkB
MTRDLFGSTGQFPDGFRYEEGFLDSTEEAELLTRLRDLAFQHMQYRQFTARRRVVYFGGRYDFSKQELLPVEGVPAWLTPLKERAAVWAGVPPADIDHALVAEYAPGTPLGWHRDVPDFEAVIGVSLAGHARMRFRRYPPPKPGRAEISVDVAPRSIYTLQGPSRWQWQHSVSPTKEMRYSITFRTLRAR